MNNGTFNDANIRVVWSYNLLFFRLGYGVIRVPWDKFQGLLLILCEIFEIGLLALLNLTPWISSPKILDYFISVNINYQDWRFVNYFFYNYVNYNVKVVIDIRILYKERTHHYYPLTSPIYYYYVQINCKVS